MPKKNTPVVFTNTIRLGDRDVEIDSNIPDEFSSLVVPYSDDGCDTYSTQLASILSKSEHKNIEFIIIPDRYFSDPEVLQTVQVRDVAHANKNGLGVVMTATAARTISTSEIVPDEIWSRIYKLSTIRHGYEIQQRDENALLLLKIAKICIEKNATLFREIVIRACGGAGPLNSGLADPITKQPIGLSLEPELDEDKASQARSFLHGDAGVYGTPEYKHLKQLTIRNQTLNIKNVELTDPEYKNVVYDMRMMLDENHVLRHIAVKAYYDTVNPVPENNPTRMGLWQARRRTAKLSFPKAVRLISPDNEETDEKEKPNHLTR